MGGGASILAPSKFASNFSSSQASAESKKLFTGLKASRLAPVAQGLGHGPAATPPSSAAGSGLFCAPKKNPFAASTDKTSGGGNATSPPPANVRSNNPFLKTSKPEQSHEHGEKKTTTTTAAAADAPTLQQPATESGADGGHPEKNGEKSNGSNAADSGEKSNCSVATPAPAAAPETQPKEMQQQKSESSSGFVFGQNLANRAANFADHPPVTEKSPAAASVPAVSAATNQEKPPTLSDKTTSAAAEETGKSPAAAAADKGGEFLFGQNLSARAANFNESPAAAASAATADSHSPSNSASKDDKPSVMKGEDGADSAAPKLTEEAGKAAAADDGNAEAAMTSPATMTSPGGGESSKTTTKTLTESAAEYFENKAAQKRKYDEVEVTTGEENEYNVIQIRAKLYLFENSKWVERGSGQLRLNDMSREQASATTSSGSGGGSGGKVSSSRIVMRTMGSLKVILNTKVYQGMSVEQPNEKSVRLTGMDESGKAKVFLVMCSPKDACALYKALKSRLAELKTCQENMEELKVSEGKKAKKDTSAAAAAAEEEVAKAVAGTGMETTAATEASKPQQLEEDSSCSS